MKMLLLIIAFFAVGAFSSPVLAEKNAAEILGEGLKSAIRFHVAEQLSVDASEIEVEGLRAMNGQQHIAPGKILKVRAANRNRLLGRVIFIVSFQGDVGHLFEQWVSADIVQVLRVVVAGRKLSRLHVVKAEDLRLQNIRLRHTRRSYLSDFEAVIGKRLTQSLRKGTPIRSDQLEIAPLVRRGDRVTITLRSQGLQIVTAGKAKEDGQLGEMIRVMNLDSKKTVFAEVVDTGDVQIVLSAKD